MVHLGPPTVLWPLLNLWHSKQSHGAIRSTMVETGDEGTRSRHRGYPTKEASHMRIFERHPDTQLQDSQLILTPYSSEVIQEPFRVVADVWKSFRNPFGWSRMSARRHLGLPGQVWELRFLPSFPSFPRENRSPKNVWESAWKSQTSFFQTSAAF